MEKARKKANETAAKLAAEIAKNGSKVAALQKDADEAEQEASKKAAATGPLKTKWDEEVTLLIEA